MKCATIEPSRQRVFTQAEATKDAQRAGIAHAKAKDATADRGRKPSFSRQPFDPVQALLTTGSMNASEIACHAGPQRMAVARIKADPAAAEAMLANWACSGDVGGCCLRIDRRGIR